MIPETLIEKVNEAFKDRIPVNYLGEGPTGMHLFADRSPMATHGFQTFHEGADYFIPRKILGVPATCQHDFECPECKKKWPCDQKYK